MEKYENNYKNELKEKIIYPYDSKNTLEILKEIKDTEDKGLLHILYSNYLTIHGFSSNIIIPYYDKKNSKIVDLIVINNPSDAERLTQKHVKKTSYLEPLLYDSIISTTNVKNWSNQRRNYQPAFSVETELKKMIPKINTRAKIGVKILNKLQKCDNEYVDIYEFFLNETMAQLQLAMFGFSNEFQEKTNKKIRDAFNGKNVNYANNFVCQLLDEIKKSDGPLSLTMLKNNDNVKSKREIYGNALIFPFAGHDTTANTLTWLIFEISKNEDVYKKLQNEVDNYWINKKEENIEYNDFKKLKYMTRCIMETLRLWTSIPNGTFRELIDDEYIIGKNNEKVNLPKGTYIQIPNWTRHKNPELWGNDVNEFNPDRNFVDEEIYNNNGIGTYNPNSERFSPFTYGPRDCIGKNFSQIEMRIILLHLLKNFNFIIPLKQLNKYNNENISFNSNTLAPRNIFNKNLYEKKFGMYVKIIPRKIMSKI